MKATFSLIVLSALLFSCYLAVEAPALGTYLIGKAASKKFACLMSALGKLEESSEVDKDVEDWSINLSEGVQQGIDVNTLLLQYQYLNLPERQSIKDCNLTLGRATERCKSVYRDCSGVGYNDANFSKDAMTEGESLPFVTRTCPKEYRRYGCCSCMRSCEAYPEIFNLEEPDLHQFCYKKAAIVSKLSDTKPGDEWEPVGDRWVERCLNGWTRVGHRLCVPKCPLGWHDHGDRCLKKEKINLIAFSWQPGDEE
jgi:hypothetical protein